jgi:hypothetical protein
MRVGIDREGEQIKEGFAIFLGHKIILAGTPRTIKPHFL